MRRPCPSRFWISLAALGVAIAVVLVWLGVNGVRLARNESTGASSSRPAGVPPPSRARPIAVWSETEGPIVNLSGELSLGYEKLAGLRRDEVTMRVDLNLRNEEGALRQALRLHFRRELPEATGTLELGALLGAVNQQQTISPQLSGGGELVISVGDRKPGKPFEPLSNSATVPCVFEPGDRGEAEKEAR